MVGKILALQTHKILKSQLTLKSFYLCLLNSTTNPISLYKHDNLSFQFPCTPGKTWQKTRNREGWPNNGNSTPNKEISGSCWLADAQPDMTPNQFGQGTLERRRFLFACISSRSTFLVRALHKEVDLTDFNEPSGKFLKRDWKNFNTAKGKVGDCSMRPNIEKLVSIESINGCVLCNWMLTNYYFFHNPIPLICDPIILTCEHISGTNRPEKF